MLNSHPYFSRAGVPKYDKQGIGYWSYVTNHPALVLYSLSNGQPLAGIQLVSASLPASKTLLVARQPHSDEKDKDETPKTTEIQGVAGKSGDTIHFVITNFISDGYVNINLLRNDTDVTVVNPGPELGVNQCNELKPLQHYIIPGDQKHGEIKVNGVKSADGSALTVQEDDDNAMIDTHYKKKAMELYVSVLPQTGLPPEVTNLFKSTVWRVTQGVVLFKAASPQEPQSEYYESNIVTRTGHYESNIVTLSGPAYQRDVGFQSYQTQTSSVSRSCVADPTYSGYNPPLQQAGFFSSPGFSPPPVGYTAYNNKSAAVVVIPECTRLDIMSSNAATFEYGKKITETTVETDLSYEYGIQSPKCRISFSVLESHVIFKHVYSSAFRELLEHHIEAERELLMTKNFTSMFEKIKKFKSETCVYCLDAEPTIVVYSCGHQASCKECASQDVSGKCAICRGVVFATQDIGVTIS